MYRTKVLLAASLSRKAIARQKAERKAASLNLGFLAAGRSGRSDIAERHEDLLWRSDSEPRES